VSDLEQPQVLADLSCSLRSVKLAVNQVASPNRPPATIATHQTWNTSHCNATGRPQS